jgi:hypothetical protein
MSSSLIKFVLLVFGAAWLSYGCSRPAEEPAAAEEPHPVPVSAGTARMIGEIDTLYNGTLEQPLHYYYLNSERAEDVLGQIQNASGDREERLHKAYAIELLYAGQTVAAIDAFNRLIDERPDGRAALSAESRQLTDFLAVSYLRLGEQQNCIGNHAAEACILPLQGGGIHRLQEGDGATI